MGLAIVVDAPLIRVVVVDDHALFRRGLENVLSSEPDLEVVGEAGDGLEALEVCAALAPDVVLMDVRMPGASGIEAARKIREARPETRVVMLTVSDDEGDLFEAVRAGANGYLLKEVSIDEVADAVRVVARGHSLISPSMASKLLGEFNRLAARAEIRQRTDSASLTDRELEVLRLVADGLTNREIARRAVHRREHGEEPRPQHPRQAPPALPHGGRRVRDAREAARRGLAGTAGRLAPDGPVQEDPQRGRGQEAQASPVDRSRSRCLRAGARAHLRRRAGRPDDPLPRATRQRRGSRRSPPRGIRCRPRGRQAGARPASLRRPDHGRRGPAPRVGGRDEDR